LDKTTLLAYMPNYYKTSMVVDNLNNANAIELDNFDKKLDSVFNQYFVDSADSSIERWENDLGIMVNNNYNTEYRRSVILSKIRGQGTVTIKLIENVAESFENGDVSIIENNALYSFTVKFIGTKGIPPNLDDLKNAIEDIKPAHLQMLYEFSYNPWSYVKTLTWQTVQANTWNTLKVRE